MFSGIARQSCPLGQVDERYDHQCHHHTHPLSCSTGVGELPQKGGDSQVWIPSRIQQLWCGSGFNLSPWCGSGFWPFFDADAYLDADPDPTFHPDLDPDPDPSFQIKAQTFEKCSSRLIPVFHTFWLVICELMRVQIRIQLTTFMSIRMQIRILILIWCWSGFWFLFDVDEDLDADGAGPGYQNGADPGY